MVRAAYDAPARWETGGPVASIRFYEAAPGAVFYPHPHVFAPRSQELQFPQTTLGELTNRGPRQWNPGTTPATMRGTHYDITEDQALGLQVYSGPAQGWQVPLCRNPCRIGLAVHARPTPGPALGLTMAANVCFDATEFLPLGFTMAANVCFHTWEEIPLGLAMDAEVTPDDLTAEVPLGLAMDAAVMPGDIPMSLPLGLAMDASVDGSDGPLSLPLGLAMDASVEPGDVPPRIPLAMVMDATTGGGDGGGGDVPPGSSCDTAASIALPFTRTAAVTHGTVQWWKFSGVAGHTYHIRITTNSGTVEGGHLYTGGCEGRVIQAFSFPPGSPCGSFTLGSSGVVLVDLLGDTVADGNYTIEVAEGGC